MKAISAGSCAGLAGLTVLCIHTAAALAQQPTPPPEAAAAPASPDASQTAAPPPAYPQAPPPQYPPPQPGYQYPPGYAPPPGYVPPQGYGYPPPAYRAPPPRYGYYPPPPPPPPPRLATERVFMIGGSLGLGALHYRDYLYAPTSDLATGYSARLGFGIAPRLLFLISIDGAVASNSGYAYDQTIYSIGLQAFLTQQLFVRGGAGIGNITQKDDWNFLYFGKAGFGLTGAVGVELLQGYNWSLELAGQIVAGFYSDSEKWTGGTVNVGFNFF